MNNSIPVFAHIYEYEYEDKSGLKTVGKYRIDVYKTSEGGCIHIHNAKQRLSARIGINDQMYNKVINGDIDEISSYTKTANDLWRELGLI